MTETNDEVQAMDSAFGNAPAPESITLAGDEYVVRPIRAGAVPRLARTLRSAMPDLVRMAKKVDETERLNKRLDDEGVPDDHPSRPSDIDYADDVVALLAEQGDALFEAIDICAGIPKDNRPDYDEVDLDELAEAVLAIVTVNIDFFTRRLLPMAARMARTAAAAQESANATPGPG